MCRRHGRRIGFWRQFLWLDHPCRSSTLECMSESRCAQELFTLTYLESIRRLLAWRRVGYLSGWRDRRCRSPEHWCTRTSQSQTDSSPWAPSRSNSWSPWDPNPGEALVPLRKLLIFFKWARNHTTYFHCLSGRDLPALITAVKSKTPRWEFISVNLSDLRLPAAAVSIRLPNFCD